MRDFEGDKMIKLICILGLVLLSGCDFNTDHWPSVQEQKISQTNLVGSTSQR